MITFTTQIGEEKYDPNKDEARPKVGSIIKEKFEVLKSEYIDATALLKMVMDNKTPELIKNSTQVLIYSHPERPYVKYVIWVKEIK